MYFDDAKILGSASEIFYQRITGNHIFDEFKNLVDVDLLALEVGTNVKDQAEFYPTPAPNGAGGYRRHLQSTGLRIIFDTQVQFQSLRTDLDVPSIIGGAFNTEEDRAEYLSALQTSSTDRSFSTVNAIQVVINGEVQNTAPVDNGDGGGPNIFIIIGAIAGGGAILILAGLYYVRTTGQKKTETIASTKSNDGQVAERVGTDLHMNDQDDISTLGDPTYGAGGMGVVYPGLEKDETVAASIVSGDYDYAKKYGFASDPRARANTQQSSSSADLSSFGGLNKMDNSLFSDDMSFEQQFVDIEESFEVDAPNGKLGMVIDTPSGGAPVVHAIKDSSVLADRVTVGDRLISVDDEDTTALTAMQVSKMISKKADNPSRILVFARTRARTMSGDMLQ